MFDIPEINTVFKKEIHETSIGSEEPFCDVIHFLCRIEGFKTKVKNLHWASKDMSIHVKLEDFLSVISEYQDSVAEDYMGIQGTMQPNVLCGIEDKSLDALTMLQALKEATLSFYSTLPDPPCYKGIVSETEAFMHELNKYKYLFTLCK